MAAVLATVNRTISFIPSFPGISGSSQSQGNALSPAVNLSFPAASVNTVITISFAFATLQQAFFWSDKGMTIKFNSTSSPVPTLVLQPGSPFEWNSSDGYFANIFTANITTAYVSCTPASRLSYYVLNT